MENGMIVS